MAFAETVTTLKTASEAVLAEILREAESRLEAQLTAAIAADQRAMTFLGFLLALVTFLVGAAIAAATASTPSPFVAYLSTAGAVGLMVAAFFAFVATRPIDFEFVGNDPESWLGDVTQGSLLHDALAEQCAHYDDMLKSNRRAMSESSKSLWRSSVAAGITVAICSLVAAGKIVFGW